MKPRPFDYVRPDTVEEAVALLAEYGDDARILDRGSSLLPMLNLRLLDVGVLITFRASPNSTVLSERAARSRSAPR